MSSIKMHIKDFIEHYNINLKDIDRANDYRKKKWEELENVCVSWKSWWGKTYKGTLKDLVNSKDGLCYPFYVDPWVHEADEKGLISKELSEYYYSRYDMSEDSHKILNEIEEWLATEDPPFIMVVVDMKDLRDIKRIVRTTNKLLKEIDDN